MGIFERLVKLVFLKKLRFLEVLFVLVNSLLVFDYSKPNLLL